MESERKLEVGDCIRCKGVTIKIKEIISQDYYEREGYFVEFIATDGTYGYWKQYIDGGKVIKNKQ